MFADSHAHLTDDEIYPNIEEILARAENTSISTIVNICTDLITLERGLALRKLHPWIFNAAATTPHDAHHLGDIHFNQMADAARSGSIQAIGETGLDYFHLLHTKTQQQQLLKRYLMLANETGLPVIIHCREAFEDLFNIVDTLYKGTLILHCFTGTLLEAQEVIKRGWYLSLSGIVTFKKSMNLKEVAAFVPLSQLLIETDAPYLSPQSNRGKKNEPAFIIETAKQIADIKQCSLEIVANSTTNNLKKILGAQ